MSITNPEFICKCCTSGITKYYRVYLHGCVANTNCPSCPAAITVIFDIGRSTGCDDAVINGHPCYTPLTLGFTDDDCLKTFTFQMVGPGQTGINATAIFKKTGIEDCLERQVLPFTFQAGSACDFGAASADVEAVAPASLADMLTATCIKPAAAKCATTINRPNGEYFSSAFDTGCQECCTVPQPAIPGVGGGTGEAGCFSGICAASLNVANGTLSIALSMPAAGPESPAPGITINSLWGGATTLGYGASSVVTKSVTEIDTSTADCSQCDGTVHRHRCRNVTTGAYMPPPDCTNRLVKNGNGTWTETTAAGMVYEYNSSGVLSTIRNAGDQAWTFVSASPLSYISDPAGRRTTFAYNASSKIRRIQDVFGRITTYTVDGSGNLTSQITPELCTTTLRYDGSHRVTALIASDGLRSSFAYDTNGFCQRIQKPDGGIFTYLYLDWLATRVIDPMGRITTLTHNVPRKVTQTINPLGQRESFTYEGSRLKTHITAAGIRTTYIYERQPNRVMFLKSVITGQGRTTHVYNTSSSCIATIDALGRRTTIVRDASQRPLATVNASGQRTTNVYDANKKIVAQINPLGARNSTVYDGNGLVKATIDALSRRTTYSYVKAQRVAMKNPVGALTTSVYDLNNRKLAEIDPLGNRTTLIYSACSAPVATIRPSGARTTNVYAFGRVKATIDPLGKRTSFVYDLVGRRTRSQSPLGRINTTVYNTAGRPIVAINPSALRTTTVFDADGRPVSMIAPSGARSTTVYEVCCNRPRTTIDPNGLRTTYAYDAVGNRIRVVQPSGAITTTVFDALNRGKASIDALGNRSTSVFDASGRTVSNINALNQRSTSVYNAASQMTASVGATGIRTTQVYDVAGRGIASINPKGFRWTTVYDLASRTVASVDPLGRRSTSLYDSNSNVKATINAAGSRSTTIYNVASQTIATIDARGFRTSMTYNNDGQTVASINALGNRSTSVYDNGGRSVASIDARGNRSTTIYNTKGQAAASQNPLGKRWTTIYSTTDRVIASQDPLGNRNTSVFDTAGRVLASVNPLGKRTTSVFNIASQVKATIDANGNRTSSVYDALNRRTVDINGLGNRTTTVYNTISQTSALVDARGHRHSFTYDTTGAQTQLIDPLNRRTTSAYDSAGQQTLRIDARSNRTTYAYSSLSQVTGRKYPNGTRASFSYDTTGNRTLMADATGRYTNTFDAVGQTTVVTSPNSQRVSYSYDSVGQRRSMDASGAGRFTYVYSAANQLSSLLNPYTERTTFAYDDARRRTVQRNANGTRVSMAYDAASQTTQVFHRTSAGATLLQLDYRYDNGGNRAVMIEGGSSARTTWSYDKQNQLLGEHRTGTNAYRQTFTYDAGSNRTLKNADGTRTTYSYDAANQLKNGQTGSARTTYAYDLTGNQRIEQPAAGARTTTTWNYENQPSQSRLSAGGSPVTMTYNGDNRRVRLVQGASTTKFVWDAPADAYLGELNESNAAQAFYTNEPQQYGAVASQRRGSTSSFLHSDALGSTRILTTVAQAASDSYLFDAWGNPISSSGSTTNPFRWVGRSGYYQDANTGLVYVRARMYQPTVSRWCSVDPFVTGSASFKYCVQSPLLRYDPSGLAWIRKSKFIYEAEGDEDSLYGLAYQITEDTRDWVCIWPIPSTEKWSSYPWARKCARAHVENLLAKGKPPYGHFLKMVAPPVVGENGYLAALRFLFRTDAYVWAKDPIAGIDAATRLKDESGQGKFPLDLLLIAGHGYGDDKICSGHPMQQQVNCFSASDVFKVADEKHNDRNTYDHARMPIQIGPPRCWLTRTAIVYGVACNTASVWAPEWASRIARPDANVKGAPSVIDARYDAQGRPSAWFTRFSEDVYSTALDFLNSDHWVDFPGEA